MRHRKPRRAAERARLLIEQAEALGEPPEDPLLLFSVLYGYWTANYVAFDGDLMIELATEFLARAEKQRATGPLIIAHRLMGTSLAWTGDLAPGLAHYDQSIALYDPIAHRPLGSRFRQDPLMATLSFRSIASWLLGYPDAAIADADRAIKYAREIGQAATLMFGLCHASTTELHCRNYAKANLLVHELAVFADQKAALFWKAFAMTIQGCLLACTGRASDAVHTLNSGITAMRSIGTTVWMTLFSSCLAKAYTDLGQFDNAWRCVSETSTVVETTKERLWEAEVLRTAGEVALKSPQPDNAKAEALFDRALAIARQQQAKSWELRAAMSMARLSA